MRQAHTDTTLPGIRLGAPRDAGDPPRALQSPPWKGKHPAQHRHQSEGGSGFREAACPFLGISPGHRLSTEPKRGPARALQRHLQGFYRVPAPAPPGEVESRGSSWSMHSCPSSTLCQALTMCRLGTQRHTRHRPTLEELSGGQGERKTSSYLDMAGEIHTETGIKSDGYLA